MGLPDTGEEAAAGAAENEKAGLEEAAPEDEFNTIEAVFVVNMGEAEEFPPNLMPKVPVLLEAALIPRVEAEELALKLNTPKEAPLLKPSASAPEEKELAPTLDKPVAPLLELTALTPEELPTNLNRLDVGSFPEPIPLVVDAEAKLELKPKLLF